MALERPKLRGGWLTLLDALLVATASAALVAALGGRTRFDLVGFRVTIRAATNLGYAAAALVVLRAWLGGRVRLFPSVPCARSGGAGVIDGERRQIASPERMSRRVRMFALVAAAGSIVWVIPQLLDLRAVPDAGDPIFSAWRIAVLAHQLATDPMHLWNRISSTRFRTRSPIRIPVFCRRSSGPHSCLRERIRSRWRTC